MAAFEIGDKVRVRLDPDPKRVTWAPRSELKGREGTIAAVGTGTDDSSGAGLSARAIVMYRVKFQGLHDPALEAMTFAIGEDWLEAA